MKGDSLQRRGKRKGKNKIEIESVDVKVAGPGLHGATGHAHPPSRQFSACSSQLRSANGWPEMDVLSLYVQ